MKIGLAQLNSGEDIAANLDQAEAMVREAAGQGADLIALPEVMHLRVGRAMADRYLDVAEPIPGPTTQRFCELAGALGVHLLLGSMVEQSSDPQRTYNTSVLLAPDGSTLASYRKVHLFDVVMDDDNADRESDRYLPGNELVTADVPACKVGLSICYDLRFGELYRALALQGAKIIFVPANFTKATGQLHWMTLLRARAIENGCFIVAPAQCGRFPGGFEAFGHSTIIDPWGNVLTEHGDSPGSSVTTIDLGLVDEARKAIPVLHHLRPDVYRKV
ncbi:MAG: carbon-nitrogen hydrolase family protein [Phycisphaeraceae bacterium]